MALKQTRHRKSVKEENCIGLKLQREVKIGEGLEESKLQGSQTWTKSAQTPVQFGKAEEITGLSNGKYCGFKILVGL